MDQRTAPPPATEDPLLSPLINLVEMQHGLFKLNLAASAEFSRRSLQALETQEFSPVPTAQMQLLALCSDWLRLSMSPISLFAAASIAPLMAKDRTARP